MQEPISSFKVSLVVASLLGGIVSLKYLRPTASRTEIAISFIWACAWTYYSAPAMIHYLQLEEWLQNVVAFTLGIFFMQIVDMTMHIIDLYRKDPQKLADAIIRKFKP